MSSLIQRALGFICRPASPIRTFSSHTFQRVSEAEMIEEETIPGYVASRYYPVRIGEVFQSRYQVLGKLGFGTSSTVWLARDLNAHQYVALKMFIRSQSLASQVEHEFGMYQRLKQGLQSHPGHAAVRHLLDSFKVVGPDSEHECLVHPPLWDSVKVFLTRNPIGRLPKPVLRIVLCRVFQALDYMHNQCHIIHTDIKADNIMFGVEDDSIFHEFEKAEQRSPSLRKEVDGRIIYVSREMPIPRNIGPPVLCDFGSAVLGDVEQDDDVQPDIYRAPEVILQIPWSYKIDVWNVGCVIWDLFEGRHLFSGTDPEHSSYRSRSHLAEMIALLGSPPSQLIAQGKLRSKFFSDSGEFVAGIDLPASLPLQERETNLDGSDKIAFVHFMDKMLRWAPGDRKSARELLNDPWLKEQIN